MIRGVLSEVSPSEFPPATVVGPTVVCFGAANDLNATADVKLVARGSRTRTIPDATACCKADVARASTSGGLPGALIKAVAMLPAPT